MTALSVYGGVPSNNVVYPESLSSRYQHQSLVYDNDSKRTKRQGNRRQRPPRPSEGDPFEGLDPPTNNRPFVGNQGQSSNVDNQRPNQQQISSNRPFNQNQWGSNGGNWPGQNQWSSNGNNQGQNQWGTNGDNQGQNQWGSNSNNQGQNQWGSNGNNQGQNQWSTNGDNQGQNNQGNRPTTQNPTITNQGNRPTTQSPSINNQNSVQTSTAPTNAVDIENQRNTCNNMCKERITNEYNPVCGSDSQTYQNRRFLDCVSTCIGTREYCFIVCNSINRLF